MDSRFIPCPGQRAGASTVLVETSRSAQSIEAPGLRPGQGTFTHYLAIVEKTEASDYGVFFPDVPGCVTAGVTLEEARAFAAEALSLHLEGDDTLPPARSLKDLTRSPEFPSLVEHAVEIIEVPLPVMEPAQ